MPHKPFPPSLLLLRQPFLRFPRSHHQPLRSSPLPSRTIIAPPRPGSGPLRERRPDRALPPIPRPWLIWARTLPLFILIVTVSTLGLFNYQKQSSSVVASTMYALRTSERGREVLGDEIYYRDWFPWIWGEMNQLHGRIDIRFGVKGTRGRGMMRFKCVRRQRMGYFETQEWSLTTEDGRVIQLLDEGGKQDPLRGSSLQAPDAAAMEV